jgi:hypothetical protein
MISSFRIEIEDQPTTRIYCWAVLASHAVVMLYFATTGALAFLSDSSTPLCWPFFDSCGEYRFHGSVGPSCILLVQLGLIALAVDALAQMRAGRLWACLAALNIVLASVVCSDYRFRANEFYMLFWLNLVVLACPSRSRAIPAVIVMFYFWAGTLKLNRDWLSGADLYHPLWLIPATFTPAACAYVVVLELGVSWLLLARSAFLRLTALVQLALFHIESFSQISWFYPLLMATILSWFAIDLMGRSRQNGSTRSQSQGAILGTYIVCGCFSICQLVPYIYAGDKALTGQGRLLALHMFEARQSCVVTAVIHRGDAEVQTIDVTMRNLPPRSICDPVIYYSRIRNLCRSRQDGSSVTDVDWTMRSRRGTDVELTTVVDVQSFCGNDYRYSLVGTNSWMTRRQ